MNRLSGKIALVTGAARGIGAAICRRFAEEGAKLVVTDLDLAASEQVAREVGGIAVRLDVTDSAAVTAAFARIAHTDMGRASAIFNTQRRVAAAAVVAVLATVLAGLVPALGTGAPAGDDVVAAFRVVFALNAALAFVGAVAALAIHDSDAADTMARAPA